MMQELSVLARASASVLSISKSVRRLRVFAVPSGFIITSSRLRGERHIASYLQNAPAL